MEAQLAMPFDDDNDNRPCTVYLDITRQDLAELTRTHIPTVIKLAALVVEEARKDVP